MSSSQRDELIRSIGEAVQSFQDATDAFDDAAAAALGLNRTDLRCASVVARGGRVSVGEVGREAGLTRGATTTAIDRIERAGYARRVRDPSDRRGVLVELTAKGHRAIDAIWGDYQRSSEAFFAPYEAPDLRAILRYLTEGAEAQQRNRQRVQSMGRIK